MPAWLQTSILLSVALTVALNVLPRLFPNATRRASESARQRLDHTPGGDPQPSVRVFFPWKWMIGLSIAGTLALNVLT